MNFKKRAELSKNLVAKTLFNLMEDKKTNLSVAADVTTSAELLGLAEELGPEICVFKTHIDIIEDFTPDLTKKLSFLAQKHNFIIFEDRKFADIGNTVKHQYNGGIYRIADWAHITNAHIVPGPGIIEGLKKEGRALLLLAEMSSKGTLACGEYTQRAIAMAETYSDFVIGFISMKKLSNNPCFIHMTPGVSLIASKDNLGQQYKTPEEIINLGNDIMIVGRSVIGAKNPREEAKQYRERGWEAHERL